MARIIVGADENAGEVAARLLEIADHQNDVQTRTDGPALAYEVPDKVYDAYVGKGKRSQAEQRANAEDKAAAKRAAADPDAIVSDDELPPGAAVVEPGEGDDLTQIVSDDELPAAAVNADPPANGEFPNDGQGGAAEPDGGQGDDPEPAQAPKKRTSTPRKRAAKSTPAAAGNDK